MIELARVSFAWPDGGALFTALNLRIEAGEKWCCSRQRSGKSTLLKLLNGLVFPHQGSLRYRGEEVSRSHLRERDFARRFRSEVVLLFQHPEPCCSTPACARRLLTASPAWPADVAARVAQWAAALGLTALLDQPPSI